MAVFLDLLMAPGAQIDLSALRGIDLPVHYFLDIGLNDVHVGRKICEYAVVVIVVGEQGQGYELRHPGEIVAGFLIAFQEA